MLRYELTLEAESDLRDIAKYTLQQWGEQQAEHYASLLVQTFNAIADGNMTFRTFSPRYPQVCVARCEHNYIFYIHSPGKKTHILAVLHERMDILTRLKDRLSG